MLQNSSNNHVLLRQEENAARLLEISKIFAKVFHMVYTFLQSCHQYSLNTVKSF